MNVPPTRIRRQSGISYVEIMVSTIILAATVIPISNAIRGALAAAAADAQASVEHFQLTGKLEQVLAEPMAEVTSRASGPLTPSDYSDAVGSEGRRIVYVSAYDGDNADADDNPFTGTDADLIWIRVELEGTVHAVQALRTL